MTSIVLVVDDEDMTRKLLRLMLERDGFTILEAEDGQQALEVIAESKPDIVILDVMMPNMDGFTTCQELRSQPETATLPIILLSARSQTEAVQAGLESGADRYMTKPISKPELVQTITELLSGVPVVENP
ncbi:MAG: response regulator [Anaerolineae bacterium]|nr:response regulator [Anaerolineae bacterium]